MAATNALPLFPLPLVVFPGQLVPLHIFEERYKALVRDCQPRGDGITRPFGIVLAGEDEVASVGCAMTIERVLREYPDGRLDVLTLGREVFLLQEVFNDRPYFTGRVALLADDPGIADPGLATRAHALLLKLGELGAGDVQATLSASSLSSYAMAALADLDVTSRQELLEARSENRRLELLIHHLRGRIVAGDRPGPTLPESPTVH